MEIKSELLNDKYMTRVRDSIIDASTDDNKQEFRVKAVEYINDRSSMDGDDYFYDMLEFVRFLKNDTEHVAYTSRDHLIYLNAPGNIGESVTQWDFIYDHECLHNLWDTFGIEDKIKKEVGNVNHFVLNIASDCVINDFLDHIKQKDMPDGLITPEYLKTKFSIEYNRKYDTQYTLYLKLIEKSEELAKDKLLQQEAGPKIKPKSVTEVPPPPPPPPGMNPSKDYVKGRLDGIKDVQDKKVNPLDVNLKPKSTGNDEYDRGYNDVIDEIREGMENGIGVSKSDENQQNSEGGMPKVPWDIPQDQDDNQSQSGDGQSDDSDDSDSNDSQSDDSDSDGKSSKSQSDDAEEKSGKSSDSEGSQSSQDKAQEAADKAQDAADKAQEAADAAKKAAEDAAQNGDPDADAKADAADKAQEAADKAQESADAAKEAAENGDAGEAQSHAQNASDSADDAESEAENSGANMSELASKLAEMYADDAQSAADEARDAANDAKRNGDSDADAKSEAADKAQKAADAAKESAEKAKEAASRGDEENTNKHTGDAYMHKLEADMYNRQAQNTPKDDDSEPNGEQDSDGEQQTNKPSAGKDSAEVSGVKKSDLARIRESAEKVINKYKSKLSGDLGHFISQCKASLAMKDTGLRANTAQRGVKGWNQELNTSVTQYVKKRIIQKQREYKKTYSRVKRGSGYVKFGEPIKPGRKIKNNNLIIDIAFYVDRSGSMSDSIDNVFNACYTIAEALKKLFSRERVVDKIEHDIYAFDMSMHKLKYGERCSANGGTMDFADILKFIGENTNNHMVNIIITDAGFNVDKSEVDKMMKTINGMVVFIPNTQELTVKRLAETTYKGQLYYIEADSSFTLK